MESSAAIRPGPLWTISSYQGDVLPAGRPRRYQQLAGFLGGSQEADLRLLKVQQCIVHKLRNVAIKLKKLCMAKDIFNARCRKETIEPFCARKKTSYMEKERQDGHHPLPTVSAEI